MKRLLPITVALFAAVAQAAEPRRPVLPSDVTVTPAKIELGRQLYFEGRLSSDRVTSCATCHDPAKGYTDHQPVSRGPGGFTSRSAPPLFEASFQRKQFADGRAETVFAQPREVLRSQIESGNNNEFQAFGRLMGTGYDQRFNEVFGHTSGVNVHDGLEALASFMTVIQSADAPVDRCLAWEQQSNGQWLYTRLPAAEWVLDESQQRGLDVFLRNCIQCHGGPSYRIEQFANTGVANRFGTGDVGRSAISRNAFERRAFAVRTLRECQRTAPYFHRGSVLDLAGVVAHYRNPGSDPRLDARVLAIRMTDAEAGDLVNFMGMAFVGSSYPMISAPTLPADRPAVQVAGTQQQVATGGRRFVRRGRR